MNKTKNKAKKYGEPYARKHLLRRGDLKIIAKETGFCYGAINQQLSGARTMHPIVKAIADKLADESQAIIDKTKLAGEVRATVEKALDEILNY